MLKYEFYTRVYDGLTAHSLLKKLGGDIYVGEHLDIGSPVNDRTRTAFVLTKRSCLKVGYGLSLAEAYLIFVRSVVGINVHKLRAVLRSASAQTVKTERKLISGIAVVVVVFTARVKLTIYKIPVPASLGFVISERNSTSVVVNADRAIVVRNNLYLVSVTLARLVDRV